MFKSSVLFLALLLFGIQPAAGAGSASAQPVRIEKITAEGGSIYLWSSNFVNPDSCATSAVLVVPAGPNQDQFLSIALTALTAQKPVTLWLSGCTPTNWYASAPVVVSISIFQ